MTEPTPKPPSSTVAKVGASTGIVAIVLMIAGYLIPLLPIIGVPKDASDKAQQAYQWAKDHPEEMAVIQKQLDGIIRPVTPVNPPAPVVPVTPPVVNPPVVPPVVPVTPIVPPVVVPPVVPVNPTPPVIPVTPVNPPTPPTLLPQAVVVVSDSMGKQIIGTPVAFVDPNKPFVVHSKGSIHAEMPGSISWVIDKSSPQDVDAIPYPDGSGYFCVLRNKATATFSLAVASSGQVSQAMVRVTCNNGPQPPPDVTPVDPKPVDPKPDPTPAVSNVRVMLIYDPMFDSPQQAIIRSAFNWWEELKVKGNDYRFYTTGTADVKGKGALAYATSKQVSPPCLVAVSMTDGTPVDAIPSPSSVEEIDSWLKKIVRK